MKESALAPMLILALLVPLGATIGIIKVTRANFVPAADIHVTTPANKTYNSNRLLLNYTAYFTLTTNELIAYSLDGNDNVSILARQSSEFYETLSKQVQLPELPDGSHHLAVYAMYPERSGVPGSAEVYFTIDTTPPIISNLSVENRTYHSANLALTFNLDEDAKQIIYSVDNEDNVTLAGNSTLTDLTEGSHTLTVYAKDEVGNTATFGPVGFTIQLAKPMSETDARPDLIPLVAFSTAVIFLFAVAAVVYVTRRRI